MKKYRIVYGAFVRMYADHAIEAEDDEAAPKMAIEEFKANGEDLQWTDAQYDNLALPSIVSLEATDPPGDVLEGHDVAATPADARQYAADKLLEALLNIMPEIDREIDRRKDTGDDDYWIALDRIAANARAAIAEATAV
jgi:hypothetical protein